MSSSQIPSEGQDVQSEDSVKEIHVKSAHTVDDEVSDESKEDECDSEHLLVRNTESFRCLTQVILSNSSLLRHPLYFFPPLVDPGIDDAFNYVEPEPVYDDIGREKYTDMCKELEIVPISRILNSLEEDTLNLKFYGLTEKQMKALTETLKTNAHVKKLVLQDNWINSDVTGMLTTMLLENSTISVLSLRECRIGEIGAEKLSEALASSLYLTELDLSFNSLGDKGLSNLQDGLCDAPSIKKLNLSHNLLTESSGPILQQILRYNIFIEDLDLSWNQFCTGPGNKKLFNGMTKNDRIKILNLAWNGLAVRPAVAPLMRYLKKTEHLEHLDLSNNRLAGASLKSVRTGILKNLSLKTVKVGNNVFSPEEALSLAAVLALKPTEDPLQHLDMENMYFKKDFLPMLTKIQNAGRSISIGGILSNYVIYGPDINRLLFERCRFILTKPKKKKAKKDFGHFILSLPEKSITKEEFEDLLKKKKMKKLDKDLINELISRFPARRQKIDVAGMTRVYMGMYPDTCLPPPKPKKKKKGKKGKKAPEVEIAVHDLETAPLETAQQEGTAPDVNVITEKDLPADVIQTETAQAVEGTDNVSPDVVQNETAPTENDAQTVQEQENVIAEQDNANVQSEAVPVEESNAEAVEAT